jgi:hypothetical protein
MLQEHLFLQGLGGVQNSHWDPVALPSQPTSLSSVKENWILFSTYLLLNKSSLI